MKVALLIDGGHLRVHVRKANFTYEPDYIEKIAHACAAPDERLFRALYYDCAPYTGTQKQPISGQPRTFSGSDAWFHDLASRNLFAVRRGILKFRGWKPASIPLPGSQPLTDADFTPVFEQKGVDMRIGLDIATIAETKAVERVILISADTDFIPAMKFGRIHGIQIVGIKLPTGGMSREMLAHVDIERPILWPEP